MVAKLFLDGIFNEDYNSPSSVIITMPYPSGKAIDSPPQLTGLMIGDPTWGAANTWGTVINDISNLSDISSLVGSESMFSWISASTMCWKGTAPLSVGIEFYLINYKKNQNPSLEKNLRSFVKLASLYKDADATVGENFKVLVHGGYAADILEGNAKYFTKSVKDVENLKGTEVSGLSRDLYNKDGNAKGSVQLQFGHKSTISNLLLSKVNVTESTIEVADQEGKNIKPLYYKVSAQFIGVKPLLTVDVDRMFVGGKSASGSYGLWGSSDDTNGTSSGGQGSGAFGVFVPK